jgi:hypothetical protein
MVGLIFLGLFVVLGVSSFWIKDIDEEQGDILEHKGDDLFDKNLEEWDITLMDDLDDEKYENNE